MSVLVPVSFGLFLSKTLQEKTALLRHAENYLEGQSTFSNGELCSVGSVQAIHTVSSHNAPLLKTSAGFRRIQTFASAKKPCSDVLRLKKNRPKGP